MKKLFSLLTLALLTLSVGAANTYVKVTSADQLVAGQKYILVNEANSVALGTINTSGTNPYGNKVDVSLANGVVDIDGTAVVELTLGVDGDYWTFDMNGEGNYLVWTSGNTLNTATSLDTNTGWNAATTDDGVVLTNAADNTRKLQYNQGSPRFACYTSNQKPAVLYVQNATAVTVAAPTLPAAQNFEESLEVTITNNETGATLYYSTDGLTWTEYTEPIVLTETTTVYAKATKDGVDSPVVSETYTKVEPTPEGVVVFVPASDKGNGSTTRGEWTIVKDGVTINCTDGTVYDENYRIYQGSTLTFSTTEGNITKIEFTGGDNSRPISNLSTTLGTLTTDGSNGTWEGLAPEVAFSVSAQARASEIRVYVDGEEPVIIVAAPSLPEECTFEESLTVTITDNEGDATLYYSFDNTEWTEYTEALTLTETTTVYAKATKDGVDSEVVSATYTKVEPVTGDYIVFNVANDKGDGSTTRGVWTIVKDGITVVCSDGTVYDANYRIYQGATLTFTSTVGNIVKIEMDGGDNSRPISNLSTNIGTLTTDGSNGTWEGISPEVAFTASAQARATEFRVYVDGEAPVETVSAPVIDPETNTKFVDSQVVTITCETVGATIYYTTDSVYQVYTEPFTITETTTVKAYAELNGVESSIVSAKYYKLTEVANIAEANALANKTDFIFNGEATVTYQNGKNLWIRDASGSGLIYGEQVPTMEQGTVLKDGWTAQKYDYRGGLVPEFQYPTGVEASEDVLTVEPFERETIELSNVNEYVIMKGMTVIAETDTTVNNYQKYYYNAADSLVLYNQFNVEFTLEEGKTYDVVGMVTVYNEKPQLYIISVTEVEEPQYLRGDVDMDGIIGISDVTRLVDYILSKDATGMSTEAADTDLDGEIGIADVTKLVDYILSKTWD